jgi:hypothetical protein
MLFKTLGAAFFGIDAYLVEVEADIRKEGSAFDLPMALVSSAHREHFSASNSTNSFFLASCRSMAACDRCAELTRRHSRRASAEFRAS